MKRSKTIEIKIDDKTSKSFTVNEMSVAAIIALSQNNSFFTGEGEKKAPDNAESANNEVTGFVGQVQSASKEVQEVMSQSCDFGMEDLKKLSPSEIDEIFQGWKEVNETFLSLLEKVGILEAVRHITQKAMSDFLRTLAT